jgi:hypothetical protein
MNWKGQGDRKSHDSSNKTARAKSMSSNFSIRKGKPVDAEVIAGFNAQMAKVSGAMQTLQRSEHRIFYE